MGSPITVIGAGLVGSLMALTLQQAGYHVILYERYHDIRSIPVRGRSINLSITRRGLRAIQQLGNKLIDDLLALTMPVSGRFVHHVDKTVAFQPYGVDKCDVTYSISRHDLNELLVNKAQAAGVTLHFGYRLRFANFTSSDKDATVLHFMVKDGQEKEVFTKGPIIAADGAGSVMRRALNDAGLVSFSTELLDHSYKQLLIPKPPRPADMPTYGLHIWPRSDHMMMGLPNLDGSFTGTLFMLKEGHNESFAALKSHDAARDFLERYYADAIPLMGGVDRAVEQVVSNSEGYLGTVRAEQWHYEGKVVLVGDASHGIVPFIGQGLNAGFEDVSVLIGLLLEHAPPEIGTANGYSRAFAAFQRERKPNTEAIADMALENYIELRDKVGNKEFLLKKFVENLLEKTFKDAFRSRHAMIGFGGAGNISYSNAKRLGIVQWDIVNQLAQNISSKEEVNLVLAKELINTRVTPLVRELGVDLSTIQQSGSECNARGRVPAYASCDVEVARCGA